MSEYGIVCGGCFWPARPMTKEEWSSYMKVVNKIAQRRFNPFKEFSEKIAVLPFPLQEVALKEFMQSEDFGHHEVQQSEILEAIGTPEGINFLCEIITGERLVTKDNFADLWPQLITFLDPESVT